MRLSLLNLASLLLDISFLIGACAQRHQPSKRQVVSSSCRPSTWTGPGSYFDFEGFKNDNNTDLQHPDKLPPSSQQHHITSSSPEKVPQSREQQHLLFGTRVAECADSDGVRHVMRGLDYLRVFSHADGYQSLPAGHALLQRNHTTWLLIGDSTDRKIVGEWCNAVGKARQGSEGFKRFRNRTDLRGYQDNGCTVHMSGNRSFSLTNFGTFGLFTPTNIRLATDESSNHAMEKPLLTTPSRIRQLARQQAAMPGLGLNRDDDPTIVTLGSCLWDMNSQEDNPSSSPLAPYSKGVVTHYREGLVEAARAARETFPGSALWWRTCMPMNKLDSLDRQNKEANMPSRLRSLQVALDSQARSAVLANTGDGASHFAGLVDCSAVLIGFEHYAHDERHYYGSGARTLVNTMLNEFFGE